MKNPSSKTLLSVCVCVRERERERGNYRGRNHFGDFEIVVFEGAEEHGVDGGGDGGVGGRVAAASYAETWLSKCGKCFPPHFLPFVFLSDAAGTIFADFQTRVSYRGLALLGGLGAVL